MASGAEASPEGVALTRGLYRGRRNNCHVGHTRHARFHRTTPPHLRPGPHARIFDQDRSMEAGPPFRQMLADSPTTGHAEPADWDQWEIYGANGSPYSQKMKAYMHWKRLPFAWRRMMDPGAINRANAPSQPQRSGPLPSRVHGRPFPGGPHCFPPAPRPPPSPRRGEAASLNKGFPSRFSHIRPKAGRRGSPRGLG